MDTLYPMIVGVFAIALLITLYRFAKLRDYVTRRRQLEVNARSELRRDLSVFHAAIVTRLKLYDAKFPPVDTGMFLRLDELYSADPHFELYDMPVVARDRFDMYWKRTDFTDDELIALWLEDIIVCPKT